jgi:diguanylate cyclase (GGDEF)-like protein
MIDGSQVLITSNLAQAAGAVVLALALTAFYRLYRRPYLLTWAFSWWAFCLALLGNSVSIYLLQRLPPEALARIMPSIVGLAGTYWQAAWLLLGTHEMITERRLPRRTRLGILAALLAVAAAFILGTVASTPAQSFFVRVGIRTLFLGLGFAAASYGIWRYHPRTPGLGRLMVSGAFLLFGLHQLHYFVIVMAQIVSPASFSYAALMTPFDFLLHTLMGISMVVSLLEEERQRVLVASERIEHLSYHDSLTDLPNRNLLLQHLAAVLDRAGRRGERVAVLFLDLDRFKLINESLGRGYADELLNSIADRLRRNLRSTDLVARLAADEFAVLLPNIESEAEIVRVAEKLLGVVRRPFALQGRELYVTASLGISRYPEDGPDPEELLKKSDIAMYQAKAVSRDHYQIYVPSMDADSRERLALESDLRKALAHGELVLYYQPVLDARSRAVEGVEALLRWQHPERGLLGPAHFLWLAEVSGLSNTLDLWVLRTACAEIQGWRQGGVPPLRLAVNLSARSFQRPDLVDRIKDVLAETGLPAPLLELEITETLAMQNAEGTLAVLGGLKELGVRIAIDDFGTGYSSLSYLTTFPIDTLKVDRSFVQALGTARGSNEIAAAVIALAESLEIGVVAEGVEREEQWEILKHLGCGKVQGYLFSRPLPAMDCRSFVLESQPTAPLLSAAPQLAT